MVAKQDYSYSMDKDLHLVNVVDAIKGNDYYCPCCGKTMIPRQGSKRRWHFAHKGSLGDCSHETYLHKVAKKNVYAIVLINHNSLSYHFTQNPPVPL